MVPLMQRLACESQLVLTRFSSTPSSSTENSKHGHSLEFSDISVALKDPARKENLELIVDEQVADQDKHHCGAPFPKTITLRS